MDPVYSIELFTAISLLVIGLSHLLQPRIWVEFFIFLHSKGQTGNIINAMISLTTGTLIFSFHFIWQWPRILITLYGFIQVLKGAIYLLKPSVGLASIGKITNESANKFRWSGALALLIAIAIFYGLIKDEALRF